MGSFLRPGGLGCDRVSAAGEEKPPVLGQENSAPKGALPCAGYFVAPYPVCLPRAPPPPLTEENNNNNIFFKKDRNNAEIIIISRLQPLPRRAQEPPGDFLR